MHCEPITRSDESKEYWAWMWKDSKFYTGKGNAAIDAIRTALMKFQNRLIINK